MRQAYPRLQAMGVGVVAVSVGLGFQAERLMADGIPFPLLIDREQRVVRMLGVRRSILAMLDPRGLWRYLRLMLRGQRPHLAALRGLAQMPGVAILNRDSSPTYVHRGRFEGDYPKLEGIVRKFEENIGGIASAATFHDVPRVDEVAD